MPAELGTALQDLMAQQAEFVDDMDEMVRCSGCGEHWVEEDGAPRACRCRRETTTKETS